MRQRINGNFIAWIVVLIGTLTLICSGHAGKVALLLLGVAINLPIWALLKTGKFTYWPAVQSAPVEKLKAQLDKPFPSKLQESGSEKTKQTIYNLDEIPYRPKTKAKQLAHLPSSNGLGTPKPNVIKAPKPAILTQKTPSPVSERPAAVGGAPSEDLFQGRAPADQASEDKLISPSDVFL